MAISSAPSPASLEAGGPSSQRSSQTVRPTFVPATSIVAGSCAGDEVALLVEDGVVGQTVLAVDGAHLASGEHGERVVGVAAVAAARDRLGEADQRDHLADAAGQVLDRGPIGFDEMALQVEVLGRIAGHAELREDRQIGALGGGAADPIGDLGGVAVDVADRGVDLGERYAQGGLRGVTAEVSPPRAAGRAWAACRFAVMRAHLRLIGVSLASLAVLAAAPAAAQAGDQWAFRQPAARPTDHPDPARHSYTVPEAPASPACAGQFCVHWVAEGVDAPDLADENGIADGDGVPDYVERVLRVGAHVHATENGKLGWREPRSDGRRGGRRGKTDVYLEELGRELFGYAAPDLGQSPEGARLPRRLHGYLVLDNDYGPFQYPGTKPLADLEVTFAHEYCHILQMNYDAYQDAWFAESTAVWMEDQVYGGVNDYLRYVRRWVHLYETPLTANSIREYGGTVWNEWLVRSYGRGIIRDAWSRALHTRPGGFSVSAYDSAIRAAGSSDFGHDFARFARDAAEWRTDGRFREGRLYPDVPRQGSLPRGGGPLQRSLNHATFQLLRVHPLGGRAAVVRASAPRGIAAGLALVGRVGNERNGHVVSRLRFKQHGGAMTVRLGRPARFERITAVLINADTRAEGFSARRLDWNYLTDTAPFRVRARSVR